MVKNLLYDSISSFNEVLLDHFHHKCCKSNSDTNNKVADPAHKAHRSWFSTVLKNLGLHHIKGQTMLGFICCIGSWIHTKRASRVHDLSRRNDFHVFEFCKLLGINMNFRCLPGELVILCNILRLIGNHVFVHCRVIRCYRIKKVLLPAPLDRTRQKLLSICFFLRNSLVFFLFLNGDIKRIILK